jgi:hypothetical protein
VSLEWTDVKREIPFQGARGDVAGLAAAGIGHDAAAEHVRGAGGGVGIERRNWGLGPACRGRILLRAPFAARRRRRSRNPRCSALGRRRFRRRRRIGNGPVKAALGSLGGRAPVMEGSHPDGGLPGSGGGANRWRFRAVVMGPYRSKVKFF